jgi:hypothetical protein
LIKLHVKKKGGSNHTATVLNIVRRFDPVTGIPRTNVTRPVYSVFQEYTGLFPIIFICVIS